MNYYRCTCSFTRATAVLVFVGCFCAQLSAQVNVAMGAGCRLEITNVMNIDLSGNWSNAGTFVAGNGTVNFNGSTGIQTVVNASGETFHRLAVNKAAGMVQLMSPIAVNGSVTLGSGDLNLNGNVLTLGPNASVSETAGNTIFCGTTGYITTVRTLNAPSAVNVGGLGIVLTSSANLGSTTVKRQHAVCTGGGNSSIKRSFTVIPTNNSSLNATLAFRYDDSELNGITESQLTMFKSADGGTTWTYVGGTLETGNNTLTLTGVNSFSMWTAAASSAPLPVQLVGLTVGAAKASVTLRWSTATEADNHGFEIERRCMDATEQGGSGTNHQSPINQLTNWQSVGFLKGFGTSTSPKAYSFTDENLSSGGYAYRIKQINLDGSFVYTNALEVAVGIPLEFSLSQNYPNPFNPATTIEYDLPKEAPVQLMVYDNLGRMVRTLIEANQPAGYYKVVFDAQGLSSGMYYYRIQAGDFVKVKKLTLLK